MKKTTKEHVRIQKDTIDIETEETLEVNELIPSGTAQNEDMEWIVGLKEQFSHTMDPILRMYNAAMNETTARFQIIKDEF